MYTIGQGVEGLGANSDLSGTVEEIDGDNGIIVVRLNLS